MNTTLTRAVFFFIYDFLDGISGTNANFANGSIKNIKNVHLYLLFTRKKGDINITRMLSNIFKLNEEFIGDLLNDGDLKIRFENRILDDTSEFCTELNVYNNDENIVFSNNFLFGIQVSKYLDEEVVVGINDDAPYQWIFIKKDWFFLIDEEISDENYGINIKQSHKIEIPYDHAIDISS